MFQQFVVENLLMKKFTVKATALAIASVCGSAAFAGSFTTPADDTNANVPKYAAEALTSSTAVTTVAFAYTMGVARTTAQDMTLILTPSTGATFDATTCTSAAPAVSGAGAATVTLKRASTTECAWDVDVTTAFTTSTVLTFTGLKLATHGLATAGSSASVTLALKDPGETSFVDNVSTVSRKIARSVQAVSIDAATSDTGTVADVNASGGPLTGFVAANDDSATKAAMTLTLDNNSANALAANGVALFDFTATTGTAALTFTGSTNGLKANKFCVDWDGSGIGSCDTGEVFTTTATTAVLSGIASSKFPAQGATSTKKVSFEADGTTQLGTGRTFALTGTITPQVGAAENLADANGKNSTAWVWSANASQLVAPYMSTNDKYVTRFSLLNTGTSAVGYSVQCYAEGSNVATNGSTGTLKASGTTIVPAADACSFSDATKPRGAVVFTINAPINTVKGTYNIVDATTGANGFVPMTRPYNSANTTE
jgi:hypothetical protein